MPRLVWCLTPHSEKHALFLDSFVFRIFFTGITHGPRPGAPRSSTAWLVRSRRVSVAGPALRIVIKRISCISPSASQVNRQSGLSQFVAWACSRRTRSARQLDRQRRTPRWHTRDPRSGTTSTLKAVVMSHPRTRARTRGLPPAASLLHTQRSSLSVFSVLSNFATGWMHGGIRAACPAQSFSYDRSSAVVRRCVTGGPRPNLLCLRGIVNAAAAAAGARP